MNEDFIHHVWKFQKFSTLKLITTSGEEIQVLEVGTHNFNAGPDFLYSKIVINGQVWAGTVEIHTLASHWYEHHHEQDSNYDTVILHVVWDHDVEVFRQDQTVVPTLVVKDLVASSVRYAYQRLFSKDLRWIPCEDTIETVDSFLVERWLERLYFERLEQKVVPIQNALNQLQNDWEALCFQQLAKAFGAKVNGVAFLSMAQSIDYSVVRKEQQDSNILEALFLGQAGLLQAHLADPHYIVLQQQYSFLRLKYKLEHVYVIAPQFFRLRPPNFPTLRLAQLANLLGEQRHLFSKVIAIRSLVQFYELFDCVASVYWETHYTFGVSSSKKIKRVSRSFIDLLVINTVIPIKQAYAGEVGVDVSEEIISLLTEIKGERNRDVTKFRTLRKFENNSMVSQSLLQLKHKYCDSRRCLHCEIGSLLLRR